MAGDFSDNPEPGPTPSWKVLVETVEQLSGARTIDDVVAVVRQSARRISLADGVTFVLREGDLCHYVDEDAIGPLWKGQKFPMSACISGWAMLAGQTAVVPDIYADARIPHDAYRPTFVQSLVMVPVRTEAPLAAIGTYWARQHEPKPSEVELLETLARATATALVNVSLDAQRAQAEEQLHQAQKMEAIGQLTGGMAHDFNNLLGIIIGNLDMLQPELVDGTDSADLLRDALEAALRGADLTRRLLAFARRQPLQPQRVEPNALVSGMVKLLNRTLGGSIEISLDLSSDVPPIVIDPSQLEASIVNLANNARDAMPRGGRLMIATGKRFLDADYAALYPEVNPGDYVMIEISDTGTGMPSDVLKRVFEPFFTTKGAGKGTGLGLSMVFGFMKQSAGHINVYSEEGAGTTFRLYLPCGSPQEDHTANASVAPGPLGGREIVLVVEDNEAMRKVVVRQLGRLGYRVIEADNGSAALKTLAKADVDVLLTDVVMPGGIDGIELARAATASHPHLKVVLTSGFPEGNFQARTDDIAGMRLLSKPYRSEDLARVLRDTLNKP